MKSRSNQDTFSKVLKFANVTKTLIRQGRIERAKRCLSIAEELLNKGSSEMKNAVSGVYVHLVSSSLEVHHCSIRDLFPESLKAEYYKQVNTPGI